MGLFQGEQIVDAKGRLGQNFLESNQVESPVLAAASLPTIIWISDGSYKLSGVQEVHTTASASGTIQVEVLQGTTAPGAGIVQLTGTISTAGAANTVVSGVVIASPTQINKGDRIALVNGGTATGYAGGIVEVSLQRTL